MGAQDGRENRERTKRVSRTHTLYWTAARPDEISAKEFDDLRPLLKEAYSCAIGTWNFKEITFQNKNYESNKWEYTVALKFNKSIKRVAPTAS